MPPEKESVEKKVNEFIANTDPRYVSTELYGVHRELGDEDYDAFAEELANDRRAQRFMPALALNLLDQRRLTIDQDVNKRFSKDEIVAASQDSKHFDAVHRKALEYVAQNYSMYADLNKADLKRPKFWTSGIETVNDGQITYADVAAGKSQLDRWETFSRRWDRTQFVIENFKQIDTNNSGFITASEGAAWLKKQPENLQNEPFLKEALPQIDYLRTAPGSEKLSLADLKQRANYMLTDVSEIGKTWKLK